MYKRHFLICDDDLKRYPPIISNIKVLLDIGCDVYFLGYCSDNKLMSNLESKGMNFINLKVDKVEANPLMKILRMLLHTKQVNKVLEANYNKSTDIVWVFGNENGWRLNKIIKKYRSILYLFEFPFLRIPLKYRLTVPFLDLKKNLGDAWKIVCCEENRGRITQAYFSLDKKPSIIPNKPYSSQDVFLDTPENNGINTLKELEDKKIILYQGAIDNKRRRLDYLIESLSYLPNDFVVCIMAAESEDKRSLQQKYEHDRVFFLPFITPPHHLTITKLAHIGYLTYNPYEPSIEDCLNLLFCAPNKIFEYSKFSIPMLANDLPSLEADFNKYNAGLCCKQLSSKKIAELILLIDSNHREYSDGSEALYNSVNLKDLIKKLIST